MENKNIALIAHLMRRAGFGSTHDDLDNLARQNYESVVEILLDPESTQETDMFQLYRYLPQACLLYTSDAADE